MYLPRYNNTSGIHNGVTTVNYCKTSSVTDFYNNLMYLPIHSGYTCFTNKWLWTTF